MQAEVPGLMDIEGEPDHVKELYGPQVDKLSREALPATASSPVAWPRKGCATCNCSTVAGINMVRCPQKISQQCEDIDQPAAA